MPSSVLSHQAPALILKVKYPKKFDGTALCLSTFIPDINVIIELFTPISLREITHSLFGLIIIIVPLTLMLTIIFCNYLGPFFASIAEKNGKIFSPLRYFGIDEWKYLNKKRYNRRFFIVATYSAIIGGLTHLLLDLPAHANIELFYPWILLRSPDFLLYSIVDFGTFVIGSSQIHADLTVYQLIWMLETLVALIISLYLLRYIKKNNLISKWYQPNKIE